MNRKQRAEAAQQTLTILARGSYAAADGRLIDIGNQIDACLLSTRFLSPDEADALVSEAVQPLPQALAPAIEVSSESTLACISRVLREGAGAVAALNFASAKSPGGGFLGGSLAQEESLACSSALYASLQRAPQFYDRHRATGDSLYTDAMILSPTCPIFRRDDGTLLERPEGATFITCAAPNAGAVASNQPDDVERLPGVLQRRAQRVLALAAQAQCDTLVLGAWGCGVFRNDPVMVASAFRQHLLGAEGWAGRFQRIVFAVFDRSPQQDVYNAFKKSFAP